MARGLLGKTSSVVASGYQARASLALRSRSTFKLLSTTTTQSRTCQCQCGAGVLYIDRGVIVLNKPPGLVSQGTSRGVEQETTSRSRTLLPNSKTAFDDVLDGLRRAYDLSTNPYPVHRLDKGTTGVLVLARTKTLARELSQQFRTRAIEKSYLALVVHTQAQALDANATNFPAKEGLIDASLSFDDGRVRITSSLAPAAGAGGGNGSSDTGVMQSLPDAVAEPVSPLAGGKAARTTWEVLASSDIAPLSLVRLYPHTGLKHQLRVHMAQALKVPILGDALYGGATTRNPHFSGYAAGIPEGRLFLHSLSISFWRYRQKGLRKRFRLTISAPLPADFVKICRDVNLCLPEDVIEGGVFVDGQRLLGDEIPDVEGRWLGGHSPCNYHSSLPQKLPGPI